MIRSSQVGKNVVLGFTAAEGPCAFEQTGERCHGVSVEWNGSMAGCRLAATDRRDSAEEILVLPAQVFDLDAATRSRNRENRRAMGYQPFRAARGGLE